MRDHAVVFPCATVTRIDSSKLGSSPSFSYVLHNIFATGTLATARMFSNAEKNINEQLFE